MNDNKIEACCDADCDKQGKLRTCQSGQKVLDWKAACWWPQSHKERECQNTNEINPDCENTNADIQVADETLQCKTSKTLETENTGGSGDDDDDDDSFFCEDSNFKTVSMRMEKGDMAFQNAQYDYARKEYISAWKHVDSIMSIGEIHDDNYDDVDDDDDDDDFEFEEPSVEIKEKCHKEFSVVATKLGEYYAIRKEWDHAIDHANMALDHDITNPDALYLLAKSHYYEKKLLVALEAAELLVSKFDDAQRGIQLVKSIQSFLLSVINKKRALFQRIIDCYRLRVDDECVRVGDVSELCPYSIYGLRAQGIVGDRAVPIKHFRAFLRMGCRNGVLPDFLLPENGTVKLQALIYMATTDDWFNIGFAKDENRIQSFYLMTQQACNDNSTESLRSMAVQIAGPIVQQGSGQHQQDIMDDISYDDDDDDDDEEFITTLTEQMHAAMNDAFLRRKEVP